MLNPIADETWPDAIAEMRDGFAGQLNVYRVMAHHPDLLRAWQAFRDHVVLGSALAPQYSEVVILRTGVRMGAPYEWSHHVHRARKLGMADARIRSIRGPLAEMGVDDRLLCTAVDQLLERKGLDGDVRAALAELLNWEGVLDVMATVAHYSLLGFILNSFEVPLDAEVAAALAAKPIG